jgi:hypothetical protein
MDVIAIQSGLHFEVAIAPGRYLPEARQAGSHLHPEAVKIRVEKPVVV